MNTQEHTNITSNPTSPTSLPSTGNRYLDRALDQLPPDAKLAVVALFERLGRGCDDLTDNAQRRLSAHVAWLDDPDVVRDYCIEHDCSEVEENIGFWMAFRSGSHVSI